jgi:hypothetical protein
MVLAKRTSKNQLNLPKAVVEAVGIADCYDVAICCVSPGSSAEQLDEPLLR